MMATDVLILTASLGNGHNSATRALVEKITSLFPDMRVDTQDLFQITTPSLKPSIEEGYRLLTKSKIPIYNMLYKLRSNKDNFLDDLLLKLSYKTFETHVAKVNPKMIISVFPTCAQFANQYKIMHSPNIKTITVITDVVANWEWLHSHTDMYCVPALDIKAELIQKGILEARIFVTGVPVRNEFSLAPQFYSDTEYRVELKHVLMLGSAMGNILFNYKTIDTLGEMPYKFTLVTGANNDLYHKLSSYKLPSNIEVLAYVDHMPDLMRRADLVVTKPGGATIFEAIACNVPVLMPPTCVGQEMHNKAFISKQGFGDSYKNQKDLYRQIELMLSFKDYQEAIARNMTAFKLSTEQNKVFDRIAEWMNEEYSQERELIYENEVVRKTMA